MRKPVIETPLLPPYKVVGTAVKDRNGMNVAVCMSIPAAETMVTAVNRYCNIIKNPAEAAATFADPSFSAASFEDVPTVADAKEAFLDLYSEATRFEIQGDASPETVEISVGVAHFNALCEALGIKAQEDETLADALEREADHVEKRDEDEVVSAA